jgi:PAS domain S-box-containing protein
MIAPPPPDETARLEALRRYQILDTPPEEAFEDLIRLGAQICDVPIAMVSFVDRDRQWFKAKVGTDICDTSRENALCSHAILGQEVLVVSDATEDQRFADNPQVTGAPHIRFYAGAPLRTADGHTVGVLCAIDTRPRTLTPAQIAGLERLARQVVMQLEFRRNAAELARAAQRQHHAELALRTLITDLPVVIVELDQDGHCTGVSAEWCRITGLTEIDAMGTGWLRAVHPGDRDRIGQEWREAIRTGRDFATEFRYVRPDGSLIWVETRAVARRDPAGRATGFVGVAQDVTARHQAGQAVRDSQARLRESEERFRALADQVPVMIWTDGPDERCNYLNATWLAFTGRTLEETVGKGWLDCIHAEDLPATAASYHELFTRRIAFTMEYRLRRHDGEYRWVSDSGAPSYLSDGTFTGYVGVITDVTEARRAREVLERERFFLGETIEKAPVAMAMLDSGMRYLAWSRKWLDDYDLGDRDLRGLSHYEIFPDIPERWKALHRRALAGESLADPEDVFERANGESTFLRWAIQPWRQADGAIGGIVMVTDVINDLVRARQDAIESSRLKSDFLASMSHEIRTPMNGVLGMTGLLLDTPLSPDQRECAETIRDSADALLTIINDILDVSKIEAGKLSIEPMPFDLHRVTEDVSDLLIPKAEEKRLELVLRQDPSVPRRLVGDAGRLRQVLTNLVGNAIKFTHRGHIVIDVTRDGGTDARPNIRFAVSDTGIGIARDKISLVFEKFTQADASTTRRFGGTGLGLAICQQLVRLMDGMIGVSSEPDQGSTFWFTLPLEAVPAEAHRRLPVLRGRVLVVDDVEPARRVISEQACLLGCTAEWAANGAMAIECLRTARHEGRPFDAMLLDLAMPEQDGEAVAREIGADPRLAGTPLILLGGATSRPADDQLRRLGIATFVRKPVRIEDLGNALSLVLGRASQIGARADPPSAAIDDPADKRQSEPHCQGARVLVVDDNSVNQKVAARMLGKLGCRVELAANGKEAVDLVTRLPFHVVFMDCMMPEMDGYEATAAIRRLPAVAGLPIVAMTANAMQGDRERCLAAGMDDYLSKPIQPGQLRAVLQRWSGPMGRPPEPTPVDPGVLQAFRQLQEPGALDVLTEFIDLFLSDLEIRRGQILHAVRARDAEGVRAASHALKSGAAYIGARELARICQEVESAARAGNIEAAAEAGTRLQKEADRAASYLLAHRVAEQSP